MEKPICNCWDDDNKGCNPKPCPLHGVEANAEPTPEKPTLRLSLVDWRVGDQYACIGNGLFVRTRARKNRKR